MVLPDRPEFCGLGDKWQRTFDEVPSFDGYMGPPGGTSQSEESIKQGPEPYTFYFFSWDDCIVVQAENAELVWQGVAYERK